MSYELAEFDKEVIRTRSKVKDFLSFFFREQVYPYTIEVPVPVIGKHRLTYDEKRQMEQFILQAVDGAEPLRLLMMAKRAEQVFHAHS